MEFNEFYRDLSTNALRGCPDGDQIANGAQRNRRKVKRQI